MDYQKEFRVKPGSKVDLKKIDADYTGGLDKEAGKAKLKKNLARIEELQELLYAEHKQSLLLVFQAMDAGGKDGSIKVIAGAMNPQGVKVTSFKGPTKEELDHDFLWRIHKATPAKGEVAVFNRSHYEDVLVVRVNDLAPKEIWSERYTLINAFEKALKQGKTHILKFFLHIDKDEQLSRFKDRLDEPEKHWKISESDYTEREKWDKYQSAYEDALSKCSTDEAQWYVIPANHKWFRDVAISEIVIDHLEKLKMQYPAPVIDANEIRQKYFGGAAPGKKP